MNSPAIEFKPMKAKHCRYCKHPFIPARPMQSVCDWACGHALIQKRKAEADLKAARADRKETRAKLEKIKPRSQWIKEAQQAMNAWIRERDAAEPCISCGRHHEGQYHAGHYLSTGARPGLRFDPRNIHKQCQPCNTHLSGNLLNYRIGLIAKIGLEAVEKLEADHQPKKWDIEALRSIRDAYRADLKRLKARES